MRKLASVLVTSCLLAITASYPHQARAADPIPVKCNDKIDGEFLKLSEEHYYAINLPAGAVLEVAGTVVGDTLVFALEVFDSINRQLATTGNYFKTPVTKTGVLSASGVYRIKASNAGGGLGLYSFVINCSGIVPTAEPTTGPQAPSAKTTISPIVNGFKGLPAVSFEGVDPVPLEFGKPEQAVITARSSDIIAFAFSVKANDVLNLTFLRKSGNLNLGLVVLSKDYKVAFQASLVTSSSLNTQFALPAAGQYTVGVFKIELVPPDKPTATKFEITAKLSQQ